MEWSSLPSEILFSSLQELDLKSLVRCTRVCKSWRLSVYDDHIWQNLFSVDFSLDPTLPYDGQSWRVKYKRKSEILRAIRNSHITLNNIIANHEAHINRGFIGEISMIGDNVIASTTVETDRRNSTKALGCHAKNIYTEEVSKQLGKAWYSKAIGDYLLSFDVTNLYEIKWNVLKVTKIPSGDISEIKFSDNKVTWDERQFRTVMFNSDPTFTNLLAVENRWRDSSVVLFDWLTLDKTEVAELFHGTPLALHKNTIVTVQKSSQHQSTVSVYEDLKLEYQFEVYGQDEVFCAVLNDHVLVFATLFHITVCNRRTRRVEYMLKRTRSFPFYLFDDLLVFHHEGLTFFDLSARKEVAQLRFNGLPIKNIIRHSPSEFVLQAERAVLLMRCEMKARRVAIMHVTAAGALKEITLSSLDLFDTALEALKTTVNNVSSSFVLKKPSSRRYIMLFNNLPNQKAKENVKANELLAEYFRTTSSHVYMPHCPYVANGPFPSSYQRPVLDRSPVKGDVIIYCEQLVDGKMLFCKPEKWPAELYTKTIGHDNNTNNTNNNQQNGKSSGDRNRKK